MVRKEKQHVSTGKTKQPDHNKIDRARKKRFYKEEDDSEEEEEDHLGITERHQRSEIATIFIQVLDSPPKQEWKKVVVFVMAALKMKSSSKNVVENVFQRILDFGALGQI